MYNLINAKLLILPAWLDVTMQTYKKKPQDISTSEGLRSIVSEEIVEFYFKQCNQLINALPEDSPVKALIDSLELLHINNGGGVPLGGASGLEERVKINTSYGRDYARYDFFESCNMSTFVPRTISTSVTEGVLVDPYIEIGGPDLFVLKFGIGVVRDSPTELVSKAPTYPLPAALFVKQTIDTMVGHYGFDAVRNSKIFELYTLVPGI